MDLQQKVIALLEASVAAQDFAGVSVLVRKDGKELMYAAAGFADAEKQIPIVRDNIFRLYSQSKPITSAAAMLLCERGQLDLMDGVEQYLPGFRGQRVLTAEGLKPVNRSVRVMDLLGMTAGLCYPGADPAGQSAAEVFEENQRRIMEGRGLSTVDFVNRLGQCPLAFQPGEHFRYSTCADVLGAVVEAVDGRSYGRFLKEELFDPLGMKDTDFWVPEEKRGRFAVCYTHVDGRLQPWTSLHLCCGKYDEPPAFESGGAGLVSTLDDYAAFAQMLLQMGEYRGRRILSPETVRFMTKAQLAPGPFADMWDNLEGYSYGKLMRVCVDEGRVNGLARPNEYGWDGWLGTYFANFPTDGLTILLMMNHTDTGTSSLTRRVRNVVLAELAAQGVIGGGAAYAQNTDV